LQLDAAAAHSLLPQAQAAHITKRVAEIKTRVTPSVPATIKATLRPYQLEGFHFLAYLSSNQFGGILADDMGLGKTLQALTWIAWLLQPNKATIKPTQKTTKKTTLKAPCLVVCPKSVSDNWLAEAKKFAPSLRVRSWRKSDSEDLADDLPSTDLLVINYAQLRLHGAALAKISWLAVILDEGQYIKNPNSQTTEFARALHAKHRLILSGTPIENRLLDLWSLLSFAMPGVLGSRSNFGKLFNDKSDVNARQRLSARVRPFLLRRTKKQVASDLPARIEEDLFCEIDGPQRIMYSAELKRAQQMLLKIKTQKELAKQTFHILTAMLRLRQICCHPSLVHKDNKESGAKLDALLELLEPLIEQGRKVLVFSQFVEALQLMKPALVERGWPVWYLTGDTEDRGALVDNFQMAPGGGVFLISLKAGSFGLNLTAASYVVLFDPWWNPAVENQAIDRTHRIGQTEPVVAYRLLIKDSIEQKIRDLQKRKGAVAEDVLGEEKFASMLTLDDLRGLFSD
jgi:SNF2 family DNA or RNA helicase